MKGCMFWSDGGACGTSIPLAETKGLYSTLHSLRPSPGAGRCREGKREQIANARRPPHLFFLMMTYHPLITPMLRVNERIADYRDRARALFHAVVLLPFACPECQGGLAMTAPSRTKCNACGHELDPTIAFQRSSCCESPLRWARHHYVCSSCHTVVPSRFLFVERVFDTAYFRERMAESRERKRRRREEMKRLLAWEHAGNWLPEMLPGPDALNGLFSELDTLSGRGLPGAEVRLAADPFSLEHYCAVICHSLTHGARRFDALPALNADLRLDRTRRFMALVFMEHFRQVKLRQTDADILVIPYGTDYER